MVHIKFSSLSKQWFQSLSELRRVKKILTHFFFPLGSLAFQSPKLAFGCQQGETQHSCFQFRSGFRFLLCANCAVKWLSHTSVEHTKTYESSTYTWSLLCQQEKNGQQDMWIAKVWWRCAKNKHCCSVAKWLRGRIERERKHRQEETSKSSLCLCFCCRALLLNTECSVGLLVKNFREGNFPKLLVHLSSQEFLP